MTVYVNGQFRLSNDGVIAVWSDSSPANREVFENNTYIDTIMTFDTFENSETAIDKLMRSRDYCMGVNTSGDLKRMINALTYGKYQ